MTKESSVKASEARILTINGGSSSITFALIEAGNSLRRILEGGIDWIEQPIILGSGSRSIMRV